MAQATLSILGLWQYDPTLFDGMTMPGDLDKTTFVDNLLFECAEFEILYPDPIFMKSAITAWSNKMLAQWQHLFDTTQYDYDPISNYDRHEEWTDDNTVNPGSTQTVAQQGYNNAGFVDASKVTTGGKDTSKLERKGRAWGNIGVTTTQQMITQEREIAAYNLYNVMIEDFKDRFCLLIY